jgi:hypothetical protein
MESRMELVRDLVHLRLGGQSLVARVGAVAGEEVVLRAPTAEDRPVMPHPGTALELGWITKAGIRWHHAVVAACRPFADEPSLTVRVLDQPVRVQRRRHARAKLDLAVDVWLDLAAEPLQGRLRDVGDRALRVHVPAPLAPGDVVQLAVRIPGAEPIRVTGRVYRVNGEEVVLGYELFARGSRERLVEAAFRHAAAGAERAGLPATLHAPDAAVSPRAGAAARPA